MCREPEWFSLAFGDAVNGGANGRLWANLPPVVDSDQRPW
jgi:hypothetical protein